MASANTFAGASVSSPAELDSNDVLHILTRAVFDDPSTLSMLSGSLLISAGSVIWQYHSSENEVTATSTLLRLKLAASLAIVGAQCSVVVLSILQYSQLAENTISATILSSLTAVCLIWIIDFEHRYAVRSTTLLALWLVLDSICDIVRSRTFFYLPSGFTSTAAMFAAGFAATVKIMLLLLEEVPKYPVAFPNTPQNNANSQSMAGFFSRSFVIPLHSRIFARFRTRIKTAQLPNLHDTLLSAKLLTGFNSKWISASQKQPHALTQVCGRLLFLRLLLVASGRLLSSCFVLLQPLLVRHIVAYMLGVYLVDHNGYFAFQIMLGAILVYGGIATSRGLYNRSSLRLTVALRGTLISAIYQKMLSLTPAEAERHSATNVIDTDVDSLMEGISIFNDIWATILESSVCIYMLSGILGRASALVVLPTIISYFVGWFVTKYTPAARKAWKESTEARVNRVSAMLSEIKVVKMIGLDTLIIRQVRSVQIMEMHHFKGLRKLTIFLMSMVQFCSMITYPLLLGGATFLSAWQGTITAPDVFVALSALTILSEPLNNIAGLWSNLTSTLASLQRVQNFLTLPEAHNQRTSMLITAGPSEEELHEHHATADHGNTDHAIQATESTAQSISLEEISCDTVFELRNANITLQGMTHNTLHNVTLKVMMGEVVLVVGRTGSGKSTFLRSVTGGAFIAAGSRFRRHASVAYCGPRAWLERKSIRENIIAYSPLDPEWYSAVLDACLLKPDLRRLPHSDKTIVGSNGMNLSDGQQHRIALARAVYSRMPVVVLDDIFNCLDDTTAREISIRLFGPFGLFTRAAITVFMTTHSRQVLRNVDRKLLINNFGRITEQRGADDSHFRDELRAVLAEMAEAAEAIAMDDETEADDAEADPLDLHDADLVRLAASNEREDARSNHGWPLFAFYLETFDAIKLIMFFLSTFSVSLLEMFPVAYTSFWLYLQTNTNQWLGGFALLSIVVSLLTALNLSLWFIYLVPASMTNIHQLLLETTVDATLNFLSSVDLRLILNLFGRDASSLPLNLAYDFLRVIYHFANVATQLAIVVYFTGGYVFFAVPILLFGLYAVQFYYLQRSRQMRYLELETNKRMHSQFAQTVDGLEHIRSFGWESQSLNHALRLLDRSQKPFYRARSTRGWLRLSLDGLSTCLGIFLAAQAVFSAQHLQTPTIAVSLITLITLSANMASLTTNWTSLHTSLGALDRIRRFCETTPREQGLLSPKVKSTLGTQEEISEDWPHNGKVLMRNVTAMYNSSSSAPPALNNISLLLPAGRRVGVVGRTGSGKSSFVLSVLNFLEHAGSIIVDGVDITTIPHSLLRSRITTVSQDNIKFDDENVRFNLCPWTMGISQTEGNVHDDSIIEILIEMGLWAKILKAGGLEAKWSDLDFSKGERQLLCIARACLHKLRTSSRLVIMDGATRGLDEQYEEIAQKIMDIAFWDCTIIQVAHSRTELNDPDIILYMNNGEVVRQQLPKQGNPQPPPPPPPPTQPTAPVPMNPFFEGLLTKSLDAERDARRQIEAHPELYGPLPPL